MGERATLMERHHKWLDVALLVVKALAAALAAITADQLAGQPLAGTVRELLPAAAVARPLPASSVSLSNSLAHLPFGKGVLVSLPNPLLRLA